MMMMKECLQFLREPAKNLKICLKESRRRVKTERRQTLTENQIFIMELARELSWICQGSGVLSRIWRGDDVWPAAVCRQFITETSLLLQKEKTVYWTDTQQHLRKRKCEDELQCVLDGDETELKREIMDWTHKQRTKHPYGVCVCESVLKVLDDLELQWIKGRVAHLQSAVELLIWITHTEHLDQALVPRAWLRDRQTTHSVNAVRYIPHVVWKWICDAAVKVTFDPETAHPALLVSENKKRLICTSQPRPVTPHLRRFNGWFCVLGAERLSFGRSYWEVELGKRDWRVGVAKESAILTGYTCLNTQSGFYTLRLERGSEMKALTTPITPLPYRPRPPRRIGVCVDYEEGQISFYDAQSRTHIYTYCDTLTEPLYPVFGTTEVLTHMEIRRPRACQGACPFC
ncbi:pyrin [Clarias gariepinus]|uniref:pyrin n=1 Tax=Clarias gariepinus TaxID=13013 RepID=UPI00234D91F1|nr:pyrin [Clarias gariepinus]XP_053360688.1 pyrin [Clarias gariepinus]